jgi:galactose mutarotase-like enzyme
MFNHRVFTEGTLETYELYDGHGTYARFVPARGGIMSEWVVKGVPVLYLDRQTFLDTTQNIRGGNPVLFPICGSLENGRYTLGGYEYEMKQHGLARNMSWQVKDVQCFEDKAWITMQLYSDETSIKLYPFNFKLVFTYVIEACRVTIIQQYFNLSKEAMPFYAGFHPYFYAPKQKAVALQIPSAGYYDIKTGETQVYTGDLVLNNKPEKNLVFTGLTASEAGFKRPDGLWVKINYDEAYPYIVLWTLQDKDFLCIEPWMGDNYDMNKGKARLLKPGGELITEVSYFFTPCSL